MDIYIKPVKKVSLAERTAIYIKDVAEVVAPKDIAKKVKNIKIMDIKTPKKDTYLISVTDIISLIAKQNPNDSISNVGEMDTIVEYHPSKSKDNPYWKWLKIVFVVVVLLVGSATAIMSFHSDSQMPEVFKTYEKIFFGAETKNPWLMDIPYSVGLAVGIIVFFNHFMGKKITDDPTPIEVEMSLYETDVNDTLIDSLNTERIRQEGGIEAGPNAAHKGT